MAFIWYFFIKKEEKPAEGAASGTTTEEKKDETKPILYIEYFLNLISEQYDNDNSVIFFKFRKKKTRSIISIFIF